MLVVIFAFADSTKARYKFIGGPNVGGWGGEIVFKNWQLDYLAPSEIQGSNIFLSF
jgi:hypothetical protein